MSQMLEDLIRGVSLTEVQAVEFVHQLIEGDVEPALAGAVLTALRAKGETSDEVRGFARAMRSVATDPMVDATGAVDVVGTGGDRSGSLNLSTGSALVTASAGVPVVKHGNRSMTSQSGSADVLEALGLPMPMNEDQARRLFQATGFTFLFAPYFHPAMAAIMPVRRALAVRTIFNIGGASKHGDRRLRRGRCRFDGGRSVRPRHPTGVCCSRGRRLGRAVTFG
jgi:anthranilate phosphoribosyltransferase